MHNSTSSRSPHGGEQSGGAMPSKWGPPPPPPMTFLSDVATALTWGDVDRSQGLDAPCSQAQDFLQRRATLEATHARGLEENRALQRGNSRLRTALLARQHRLAAVRAEAGEQEMQAQTRIASLEAELSEEQARYAALRGLLERARSDADAADAARMAAQQQREEADQTRKEIDERRLALEFLRTRARGGMEFEPTPSMRGPAASGAMDSLTPTLDACGQAEIDSPILQGMRVPVDVGTVDALMASLGGHSATQLDRWGVHGDGCFIDEPVAAGIASSRMAPAVLRRQLQELSLGSSMTSAGGGGGVLAASTPAEEDDVGHLRMANGELQRRLAVAEAAAARASMVREACSPELLAHPDLRP